MKRTLHTLFLGTLASLFVLSACSSKKDVTTREYDEKHKKAGKTTEWDYDKIREVKKAEAEAYPTNTDAPTATLPTVNDKTCHPLSKSQVERAKIEGCRKMDPKEGFGDDSYCCPNL